ncbi:ABC transporter permease [Bacillota bacterium Meth-B3]
MRKKKWRGLFLLAPGLCLMAFASFQLMTAPKLLQYAVAAPAPEAAQDAKGADPEQDAEGRPTGDDPAPMRSDALKRLAEDANERLTELSANLTAFTICAERAGVALSSDDEGSASARLVAAGERYFDVYPKYLLSGRLPDPDELKYGDPVVVLDVDLAIKLFSISEPIDRVVTIDAHAYRVAGVVRHQRSPGEHDPYSAYIPLASAAKRGIALDSCVVGALPIPRSGAGSAFSAAMNEAAPGGDCYDLSKEALRARALPRLVLIALALWLVMLGFRAVSRFALNRLRGFGARLRREYLRDMLGGALLTVLTALAGYALLLGACWALAAYAAELLYTFPEWVPAVLVEWADIRTTFWSLVARASKPVQRVTIELKRIQFYAILMRWGMVAALAGGLMGTLSRLWKADERVEGEGAE